MMLWAGAFLTLFFTDLAWAAYVNQVKEGDALRSAAWALVLFVVGGLAVIGYTSDHWLLIPSAAGAFCGTYTGVIWNKKAKTVAAS